MDSLIYWLTPARSLAVDHVQEATRGTEAAIVYIYCDYKNPRTQSELELLSSIARQLIEQTRSIPAAVKEFCDKNAEKRRHPTGDEWTSLVESICLLFQTTYIFVDALVVFVSLTDHLTSFRVTDYSCCHLGRVPRDQQRELPLLD